MRLCWRLERLLIYLLRSSEGVRSSCCLLSLLQGSMYVYDVCLCCNIVCCVCVRAYTRTQACMYCSEYLHIYTHTRAQTYARLYAYVHTYIHTTCPSVSYPAVIAMHSVESICMVYVSIYVCIYIYTHTYICAQHVRLEVIRAQTHVHVYVCMYVCVYTCICAQHVR
jgi:hypothetical protein